MLTTFVFKFYEQCEKIHVHKSMNKTTLHYIIQSQGCYYCQFRCPNRSIANVPDGKSKNLAQGMLYEIRDPRTKATKLTVWTGEAFKDLTEEQIQRRKGAGEYGAMHDE